MRPQLCTKNYRQLKKAESRRKYSSSRKRALIDYPIGHSPENIHRSFIIQIGQVIFKIIYMI